MLSMFAKEKVGVSSLRLHTLAKFLDHKQIPKYETTYLIFYVLSGRITFENFSEGSRVPLSKSHKSQP